MSEIILGIAVIFVLIATMVVLVLFMRKMAELTQVRTLTHERDSELLGGLTIPKDVELYSINGSFFFGAANKVMEVERSFFKKPKALVLEMSGVLHLDTSGMKVLEQIHQQCQKRGTRLLLVGIHAQPMMAMQMGNKYEDFGEDNFKGDLKEAFRDI